MEKAQNLTSQLFSLYSKFRDAKIRGRLVTHRDIKVSLELLSKDFTVEQIGESTAGQPIHMIAAGTGEIKILAWSQMHGNETTTTKAVFDLFNAFKIFPDDEIINLILQKISLRIIPILNPDGAVRYTRENINGVDLNRDANNLREVESRILRKLFDQFEPHFCFNLHDQRTIFSAGKRREPATLSFLTPSMDEKRNITSSREISMKVIASVNSYLQPYLTNRIGRYDDSYNINCTGDTFQSFNVPTLLFEAGHFPMDYEREETRKYVTFAILAALYSIASNNYKNIAYQQYLRIPENQKLFYDVILRKAKINNAIMDVAIQFKETLDKNQIVFIPFLEKIEPVLEYYGHKEIDCEGKDVKWEGSYKPYENVIVNKIAINNVVLIIN